jgi:hypothetical protein
MDKDLNQGRPCPLCGAQDYEGHDFASELETPDGVEVSGNIVFCPIYGEVTEADYSVVA